MHQGRLETAYFFKLSRTLAVNYPELALKNPDNIVLFALGQYLSLLFQ